MVNEGVIVMLRAILVGSGFVDSGCANSINSKAGKAMRGILKRQMNKAILAIFLMAALMTEALWAESSDTPSTLFPSPISTDRLVNASQESHNWLSHGRTYDESRFSPLNQINDSTVKQLGLAWSFETADERGLEATPIVVDGVMYSVAAWSRVYAHNAKTGELLWEYDPKVPKKMLARGCCGPVNRGAAVWGDNVYVGSFDGYLISLDRKTGSVNWRVLTVDPEKDYTITGAPRVFKGNVLIGNGGADLGVRGYVSAYDAVTGKLSWRFYTVPGNPKDGFENTVLEEAAKTWTGSWWDLGGGGTVWDSMSYDPELNLIYIGVGNGSPWNHKIRSPEGGDNLFLSSIVALNADSGEYVWHYQTTPGESWDFTATQQIILADIEWKGANDSVSRIRKVLMQAPKNGFFFIIDRVTGEYLSAKPFSQVKWAVGYDENGRPIEAPGARYLDNKYRLMPTAVGAHNWHSMSFSHDTGLVYIPVLNSMMELAQPINFDPKPGHMNTGVEFIIEPLITPYFMQLLKERVNRGELVAWDPKQQKVVWTYRHARGWNGGALSTAGNLVFQGTADQQFMAFNATNGDVLWSFDTKLGIVAAPVSYSVDGEQYVAVMAKWGGVLPLAIGLEPLPGLRKGRLLVFKLNATASLPPAENLVVPLVAPPSLPNVVESDLAEGKQLYDNYCFNCHGNDVIGSGNIPDLRHMNTGRRQAFNAIVLGGILEANGMVGFSDVLDEEKAAKVYAYILQQANLEFDEKGHPGIISDLKFWAYGKLADLLAWLAFKL